MPSYDEPSDDGTEESYSPHTFMFKIVSEYTGLNFIQIQNMPVDEYMLYAYDGYIWKMNQSEKGREYLVNAKRMTMTKPDYTKAHEFVGK